MICDYMTSVLFFDERNSLALLNINTATEIPRTKRITSVAIKIQLLVGIYDFMSKYTNEAMVVKIIKIAGINVYSIFLPRKYNQTVTAPSVIKMPKVDLRCQKSSKDWRKHWNNPLKTSKQLTNRN